MVDLGPTDLELATSYKIFADYLDEYGGDSDTVGRMAEIVNALCQRLDLPLDHTEQGLTPWAQKQIDRFVRLDDPGERRSMSDEDALRSRERQDEFFGHPDFAEDHPIARRRGRVTRDEARDMAEAHGQGHHDEIPREGCPECEGRELRNYPKEDA